MKLNLEIELDWIDEEMQLDDAVKKEVIDSITSRINQKVEEQVTDKINKIVDETVVGKINTMTEELFNEFLEREVSLTDSYGDIIQTYPTLQDLVKKRFDDFMIQTVDDEGNTYDGSYQNKQRRIDFIIKKQLEDFADKFTSDAVTKVSAEIKSHVQQGLTQKLGSELMKVLKVEKMLQLNGKRS